MAAAAAVHREGVEETALRPPFPGPLWNNRTERENFVGGHVMRRDVTAAAAGT